ncbi:MAG: GNAT family N-acetyltransferase [Cellulomonadaceae bacterium]
MALFTDTADVSVRPAVPGDDEAVTAVQLAAWRAAHADVLGEDVLGMLDTDRIRAQWAEAITAPPGPGFAVLVAMDAARLVGFAAVGPGQIVALEVLPGSQRSGHGSRLLSAAVDRLRQDGADEVATWVMEQDTARESFLAGAGLGADGRVRTLAAGPREVRESRWSARL